MKRGDHIRVRRIGFWHHGIYIGDWQVIHYNSSNNTKSDSTVKVATLSAFEKGTKAEVVEYKRRLSADEAVNRAKNLLGRKNYNFFSSNCEHIARWCATGHLESEQVETGILNAKSGSGAVLTSVAEVGAITALGTAAGLSGGAATMTTLSSFGAIVGGGAMAGVGVLAAPPTIVAIAVLRRRYRDDSNLPNKERIARKAGREGTAIGGALGIPISVGALYGAGTVGLSSAGITSGLAAVGGIFGAGMLGGVVALASVPTIVAGVLGYIFYRKRGGRG